MLDTVEIYADGACSGNPGPGGYGTILKYGEVLEELSGGYHLTTNNRMEIMAAIVGLADIKNACRVILYSDSRYLIDAMSLGWVQKWQAKGWKRGKKESVKNVDLWVELTRVAAPHQVEWVWLPGHAGHSLNERCDKLATKAIQGELAEDEGY